jgi:hypothetical protein
VRDRCGRRRSSDRETRARAARSAPGLRKTQAVMTRRNRRAGQPAQLST